MLGGEEGREASREQISSSKRLHGIYVMLEQAMESAQSRLWRGESFRGGEALRQGD